MRDVLELKYASSLTEICEVNESFDRGVLRVCYPGKNQNGSNIPKEVIERCLKTIYNCPVVCHYDRETDSLGGHDMELVKTSSGDLRLVNLTQPVGVVPESAKVWFENYQEEDGTVHEYLYTEVLLWKRQEAYRKIKRDGITAHSMEIAVKKGMTVDGVYDIEDFEFTAFALIGVEPCYESSALEVFSNQDFKRQMQEMMRELKETFSAVNSLTKDQHIDKSNDSTKGGNQVLDQKNELLKKYGIEDAAALDFSIDELTIEELTAKLEAALGALKGGAEPAPAPEKPEETPEDQHFELTRNLVQEIQRALSAEKTPCQWACDHHLMERYCYEDYDQEKAEVYCWDTTDWLLYGFAYAMDGDSVKIDFGSKQRKKYAIVDFTDGEQGSPLAEFFNKMSDELTRYAGLDAQHQEDENSLKAMRCELDDLKAFKAGVEEQTAKAERAEVMDKFHDLDGQEAFEKLRDECMNYDLETLEEKCYAIRGRNSSGRKFSLDEKSPKIKIDKHDKADESDEPYGGVVRKYIPQGSI